MSDGSKSYEQGVQDGVKLWGEACGKQANCDSCPIGMLKGANITCQEFAQKFSPKMTSMLKEMRDGDYTYFDEYVTRFPETKDNGNTEHKKDAHAKSIQFVLHEPMAKVVGNTYSYPHNSR